MTERVDTDRVPTPLSGPLEEQRERTVAVLKDAFEQDVMNVQEYEERIALALTAGTDAELEILTRDVSTALEPQGDATALTTPATIQTQRPIKAVFGAVQQQGAWHLAPQLRAQAVFGEARIDLTQVTWVENHAEIDCKAVFGSIVIVVPAGVQVDCTGLGLFGEFANKTSASDAETTHRLTVNGKAVFGSVEVVNGK